MKALPPKYERLVATMMIVAAIIFAPTSVSTAEARGLKSSQAKLSRTDTLGPRPRAWCGWYMRKKLRVYDRRLNRARLWNTLYGVKSKPRPGAVVVWRNHVGLLVSHVRGDVWVVHSGNDSRRVRTRARSIAGAIGFRTSSRNEFTFLGGGGLSYVAQ